MHKEMKNYYSRCISPIFFVNALMSLAWRTYLAIFRRIIPNYRALMLPKNISKLRKLVLKNNIEKLVIGIPKTLKNTESIQTKIVIEFIQELQKNVDIPIETVDERLSSVSAQKSLVEQGIKTGHNKGKIDETAAAIFLQEYLDSH